MYIISYLYQILHHWYEYKLLLLTNSHVYVVTGHQYISETPILLTCGSFDDNPCVASDHGQYNCHFSAG